MSNGIRMLLVLTAFSVASGLVLAWTNAVTRAPIENARRAEFLAALRSVLPACDNDVAADCVAVVEGGRTWTNHVARKGGVYAGAAFRASADGYGGPIELMVGLRADGTVNGLAVVAADRETPGLGSRIKEAAFLDRFKGRSARDARWCAVRKDGGEIDAITGATISSRAVAQAVRAGLEAYAGHAGEIERAP
ncbi:MAG: RnfABCDGE type electron transport complex subunit G [Lentisphaerae bacterium]|nr:RnfABCDGE type electron transport complex subunit G [Lentisphaerota bacterium]